MDPKVDFTILAQGHKISQTKKEKKKICNGHSPLPEHSSCTQITLNWKLGRGSRKTGMNIAARKARARRYWTDLQLQTYKAQQSRRPH